MSWLKGQLGTLLTAVTLLIAVGISFGQLKTRQDDLCAVVTSKADKETVQREMDQLQSHLVEINRKLDALLLQRAGNP
jgi:hypothetical protein